MAPPRRKKPSSPVTRILLWSIPVVFVLLVAAFIGGRMWLNSYLQSAAFRQLIGDITAREFKATGEYQPFHFAGTAIYSDAFQAHGTRQAVFSELGADQIRAEVNLGGLWQRAWQIDEVSIQRLRVALGHTTSTAPATEEKVTVADEHPAGPPHPSGWLPNRVDLRKVSINETDLSWGENTAQSGSLNGASLTITPDGNAWRIAVEGGEIVQQGWPGMTLNTAHLRYQKPTLFITDCSLRNGREGGITLDGEVDFDKQMDVQARINGIPVTPFLREDWRAKLKGNINGDLRIRAPLPLSALPELKGTVGLTQGELVALPVLDQIATFTSSQRFRRLNLNKATTDFTQAGGVTTLTNLVVESDGLIRIEGGCVVQNGTIDGTFQVGVTQASLQWLPGSQEKVFTVSRDGYLWTTMRLTGPVDHPNEDLSPRLIAAAGGTVIDTISDTIKQIPGGDKLPEAPKKLINDLLSPLVK